MKIIIEIPEEVSIAFKQVFVENTTGDRYYISSINGGVIESLMKAGIVYKTPSYNPNYYYALTTIGEIAWLKYKQL